MAVSVAIVMPAWNAAGLLEKSVPAALAAAGEREVLVVDAGSTDDTAAIAERLGARVHRLPERVGPAAARNAGVDAVDADVVLFIDADCVAAPDVVDRVARAFRDEDLVTLTGSYDDAPPETNVASLYMNLRHHYTHQRANRENATFWAGCGAVRRKDFLAVGGFDAERYPRPMIEDIELGMRLKERGAARLDPSLHVKHLKRWTVGSVIHTDIFCRAIPWTRLIRETGKAPDDLNLRLTQRLAALVAPFALIALVAIAPLGWIFGSRGCLPCFAVIVLSILMNVEMINFFAKKRGPVFAAAGWLFHQVHLTYSATTYVLCSVFGGRS